MARASPLRGLICEDQALIAFEVQSCLEEAGLSVAGCFGSGAGASAWLASNTPDFAILDFKLKDGPCTELIRLLKARDVPVLIYSGWTQNGHGTPQEFGDLPWLSKPLDCDALLAAVKRATNGPGVRRHAGDEVATANETSAGMMAHSEEAPARMKGTVIHLLTERLSASTPLADTERHALADACARTMVAVRGQTLAHPGGETTECHVLASGLAAAYKLLPDGKRQIVGFVLPGDFVDLEAYVSGRMDYGVSALSSCSVAVIPHAALKRLGQEHPTIALALWRDTLLNAAIHREWVVNVGQRMATERLAHLICETSARLASLGLVRDGGGEKSFTWPVTQADIADATGLSTVHVNRTIQELRARELIEFRHHEVTVLDWPRLQSLAGFDPGYLSPAEKASGLHLQ